MSRLIYYGDKRVRDDFSLISLRQLSPPHHMTQQRPTPARSTFMTRYSNTAFVTFNSAAATMRAVAAGRSMPGFPRFVRSLALVCRIRW